MSFTSRLDIFLEQDMCWSDARHWTASREEWQLFIGVGGSSLQVCFGESVACLDPLILRIKNPPRRLLNALLHEPNRPPHRGPWLWSLRLGVVAVRAEGAARSRTGGARRARRVHRTDGARYLVRRIGLALAGRRRNRYQHPDRQRGWRRTAKSAS